MGASVGAASLEERSTSRFLLPEVVPKNVFSLAELPMVVVDVVFVVSIRKVTEHRVQMILIGWMNVFLHRID